MLARPLFSLLDHARMIEVSEVVLVVETRTQYRVKEKTLARLREAGWIAPRQEGNITEYALTDAGKEAALRLKAHNESFIQLSFWEAEKARHEQQTLFPS